MGGGKASGDHGHGAGHGGGHGHDHHHHKPRVYNSVINYHIPDPGHHVESFKVPDWKIYKVENAPNLVKVQSRLARLGLKDPWLRNEVWRYDPQFGILPGRTTLIKAGTSGMKYGLILAVGTVLLQTAYQTLFGKEDAHAHGHGHGHH